MNWNRLRGDFPVTRNWAYLDHAAGGPIPKPVYEAAFRMFYDTLHFGDLHWGKWLKERESIRAKAARFIQADPEEIAFVHSTSEAMNLIADLIAREGTILTNSLEFPASTLPWLYRRAKVVFQKPQGGKIELETLRERLRPKVKTILTSHVQYQNGFRQDLPALGKIKGNRYLVVNATQAFGYLPIRVKDWKIDFLCSNSYKWLMAGYGGGILFVKKPWLRKFKPAFVGWRSMRFPERHDNRRVDLKSGASRYEYGCPSFLSIFSLGAAVDYLERIGIDRIERRVLGLTDTLIERLQNLGLEIASPLERKYRSGIIVFKTPEAEKICRWLLKRKIYVSPRGEGIRVAPHFYNNEADIDRLIEALKRYAH